MAQSDENCNLLRTTNMTFTYSLGKDSFCSFHSNLTRPLEGVEILAIMEMCMLNDKYDLNLDLDM